MISMGPVPASSQGQSRKLKVAAAQVGAVHRWSERSETLVRLLVLLEQASEKGAQLVVFPETTLTTFFPRYFFTDQNELDSYFEHGADITQNPHVASLFERANQLGVDIYVGYAERTPDGHSYNTCVYYSAHTRSVLQKYHKSHLPGTKEPVTDAGRIQQLEKRYFEQGREGFEAFRVPGLLPDTLKKPSNADAREAIHGTGDPIVGLLICNDRRWSEAWRIYGLQGVEMILCGYNTTAWAPHLVGRTGDHLPSKEQYRADAYFHHRLVMQSNSYTNSCFSICAARCGSDDNEFPLIGGSCIVGPDGKIIAEAESEDDEIVFAEIDLKACRPGKETTFNFDKHRRPELYGMLATRKGVIEPELLSS